MPKFISNERLAYFTSLETAAQNIVGADSNLEDCADASELEALLTTEQPDLQAIGDAACDTLFADAGIERGEDESHESALAHHLAEFALAKSSLEKLTASINAAGLTLPVASADTDITSEFITSCISEQLETMISNKSIEQSPLRVQLLTRLRKHLRLTTHLRLPARLSRTTAL